MINSISMPKVSNQTFTINIGKNSPSLVDKHPSGFGIICSCPLTLRITFCFLIFPVIYFNAPLVPRTVDPETRYYEDNCNLTPLGPHHYTFSIVFWAIICWGNILFLGLMISFIIISQLCIAIIHSMYTGF